MIQKPVNKKTCSTSTHAINGSSQNCFCLFRTLFDNSVLVTVLTIGIFFGLIQTTSSSLIPSYYSGALSQSSRIFTRPGVTGGSYYYQAIQVTVYTTGTYIFASSSSMDTYGYFYSDSFDPSYPSRNLITSDDDSGGDNQFRINVTLSYGRTYVLVVTTYSSSITGSFSITALGPAPVSLTPFTPTTIWSSTSTSSPLIPSSYSGVLSQSSGIFTRPGGTGGSYYYQAIQVTVYTAGRYTFASSSFMDTYGYFYSDSFDPSYPSRNLIASDDDSGGGGQFRINVTLSYGHTYVLVVTTYSSSTTGSFSITALGPASVSLAPFTPTTIWSSTSTSSPLIPSYYSAVLSQSSGIFTRPNGTGGSYYYQAIQVTVYTAGKYTFASSSSMDTYGYFYSDSFDPFNPSRNLMASDDDSGGDRQFRINVTLSYGRTYVLVVTTYASSITGSFSIIALGPASVSLTSITPTTTTYSGSLTGYSPRFARPSGFSSNYYYQAIQVTVYTAGAYTFASSTSMDPFGYFYHDRMDPSYPSRNLITSDDDSGGHNQFRINVTLSYGRTYVLVFTTYSTGTTGSFSVIVSGPALVGLVSITPTPTTIPLNPIAISGIVVGCVIFFVILFGICSRQHYRSRTCNQVDAFSACNQNVQTPIYSVSHTGRNATGANRIPVSYATSTTRLHNAYVEKPPPSYDSIISSLPAQQ